MREPTEADWLGGNDPMTERERFEEATTADDSLKEQTPYAPYTPETEAVRLGYSYRPNLPRGERHHPPLQAEFDRWLAGHEQKVRAEAWAECLDEIEQYELNTEQAREANPYDPKETR